MRITGRDLIKKAIKQYSGSGTNFFTLKDDGDKKVVRFLHTDDTDLDVFVVHAIEEGDRTRLVGCLQEDCPLCAAGLKPRLKVLLSLYDYSEDKVAIWERGPAIIDTLLGFIDKYGHLNNRKYEIVRHGKKGDNKTTYQLFPEDKSEPLDVNGEPLKPRPDVVGRGVSQWTKEEMEAYVAQMTSALPVDRRGRTAGRPGPGF